MAVAFAIVLILLAASSSSSANSKCFESIVSFGDSLTDTGNFAMLSPPYKPPPPCALPPYGQTFFHHPTGRFCDGRIIIDFIAESLGLPLVPPYLAGEKGGGSLSKGVNFAVGGATALPREFFKKRGIQTSNVSLGVQWDWFKKYLATIPDGKKFLQKSLIVMGEMGGNDYNTPIAEGKSLEESKLFVPKVIDYLGSKIKKLIKLGAKTILVPAIPPIGCMPSFLTQFMNTSIAKDYDQKTGCLNPLNVIARYHNELLLKKLSRLQELYPHVAIIYADYYNAAMRFYLSPNEFGGACCGTGEPYHYDNTAECGDPHATPGDDPSLFASWDGKHWTEAAYKVIAQGLIEGPYTIPHITTVCPNISRISAHGKVLKRL